MEYNKKWIKLISRLLSGTQKGEIRWKIARHPAGLPARAENVGHAYIADFLTQSFRLYEYQYKNWMDVDEFEWGSGLSLEFIDRMGSVLYQVPSVEGVQDLYEAVQYQTADVDNFLAKLDKV